MLRKQSTLTIYKSWPTFRLSCNFLYAAFFFLPKKLLSYIFPSPSDVAFGFPHKHSLSNLNCNFYDRFILIRGVVEIFFCIQEKMADRITFVIDIS